MKKRNPLEITTPSDREIAMTRVFSAPRRMVWDAMTKPELVKRWLGAGSSAEMSVCEIDLRVGGQYRYVWKNHDGSEMGMGGVYREIVSEEKIVSTEKFDQSWYPGERSARSPSSSRIAPPPSPSSFATTRKRRAMVS